MRLRLLSENFSEDLVASEPTHTFINLPTGELVIEPENLSMLKLVFEYTPPEFEEFLDKWYKKGDKTELIRFLRVECTCGYLSSDSKMVWIYGADQGYSSKNVSATLENLLSKKLIDSKWTVRISDIHPDKSLTVFDILSNKSNKPQQDSKQLTEKDLSLIKNITAQAIVDLGLTIWHKPFIFCPKAYPALCMGPDMGYHSDIIKQVGRSRPGDIEAVSQTYLGNAQGSIGRIGRDLIRLWDYDLSKYKDVLYPNLEIVAFYDDSNATKLPITAAAVKNLLQAEYIKPTALVVFFPDRVVSAAEFAKHAAAIEPITTQSAKNKLGMQANMQKAGLITPGQKWWAPTSESKR